MANAQDVVKAIAMLQAAYSNFTPNQYTPEIYLAVLGDIPGDLLSAAVIATLAEPRAFAPAPGELRAAAIGIKAQASGIPSAAQAYAEVCAMPASMITRTAEEISGKWFITEKRLHWSHPFVGYVADLLGFPRSFPGDNAAVDRAQFYRVYDAELQRETRTASQPPQVAAYLQAATAKLLTDKEIK